MYEAWYVQGGKDVDNRHWYIQGFESLGKNIVCKCVTCQDFIVGRGQSVLQSSHIVPDEPIDHTMMNFIELNPCEGKTYCLVLRTCF